MHVLLQILVTYIKQQNGLAQAWSLPDVAAVCLFQYIITILENNENYNMPIFAPNSVEINHRKFKYFEKS